jgi:hypothetical protein
LRVLLVIISNRTHTILLLMASILRDNMEVRGHSKVRLILMRVNKNSTMVKFLF